MMDVSPNHLLLCEKMGYTKIRHEVLKLIMTSDGDIQVLLMENKAEMEPCHKCSLTLSHFSIMATHH